MKKSIVLLNILFIFIMILVFGVDPASAASVTIVNPSFEDPALADGSFDNDINYWDETNDQLNVTWTSSWNPPDSAFNTVPDGQNVGLIYRAGWIAQGLSINLAANTTYTLEVRVGKQSGGDSPLGYVGLAVDGPPSMGTLLAQKWYSLFPWDVIGGDFRLATVTFQAPAGSDDIGKPMWVYLVSTTSYTNSVAFDAITLDATPVPVPGALWLLSSGIIGIVGIRRRLRVR